ncbi:4-oxalocrotonate tautomerase [Burkholderia gladioli]|uniref:tautomerase family protein n=1 Tax=Burkholderia gladioli TaxID=28095 RepID=UPI00075BD354|nr:tautomerase family protein [Burkholderia gladioli]KVM70705.1 4-oxalocrotonate tautomerase [Burkholderia gladioli]
MPTLEVYLSAGQSEARKSALIAGLTQATVDAIGAPADSVRVLINELPTGHHGTGGRCAAQCAAPSPPVIIAILIAGRTLEQKQALIEALVAAAASTLDSPLDATHVLIKDIPNTEFGIGGKTAKSLGR